MIEKYCMNGVTDSDWAMAWYRVAMVCTPHEALIEKFETRNKRTLQCCHPRPSEANLYLIF